MASKIWEKKAVTLPDGRVVTASCPIIVSASRATDIPAFFSKWFENRFRAGYMRWTNPFNANQVDYISFCDTRVFVFWSKNPRPLIPFLSEIDAKGINFYLQFTVNDYERENLEPNVPPLSARIDTFRELVEKVGRKRVIWRFDPFLLTDRIDVPCLLDKVAGVAEKLRPLTDRLVFSFADIAAYAKVRNNLQREGIIFREFTPDLMMKVAEGLQALNKGWGFRLATCAESQDLGEFGIEHNRCIDDNLLVELFKNDQKLMQFLGYEVDLYGNPSFPYKKDKGQRKECGCIVSKDIGMYDTCRHHCIYCYANVSRQTVEKNLLKFRDDAESLLP